MPYKVVVVVHANNASSSSSPLTRDQVTLGKAYNHKVDVFAFGLVLLEIAIGYTEASAI